MISYNHRGQKHEKNRQTCVDVKKEKPRHRRRRYRTTHHAYPCYHLYTSRSYTRIGLGELLRGTRGWKGSWTNKSQCQNLPRRERQPPPPASASLGRNPGPTLPPSSPATDSLPSSLLGRRRLHSSQSTPHVGLPSSHDPSLCCPSSPRAPLSLDRYPVHVYLGPHYSSVGNSSNFTTPPPPSSPVLSTR